MRSHPEYSMSDDSKARIKCESHGMSHSRLYRIWHSMKNRCAVPSSTSYKHYGGKGIAVCDSWKSSFTSFYTWAIENGYRDDLSIDRIDNSAGYSPENCRWATVKEQRRNRCYNRLITFNGKTQCIAAWAEELGISQSALYQRVYSGKSIEECFSQTKL